jgi:LAO/AO transport system kinase
MAISALHGRGIDKVELWLARRAKELQASGERERRRAAQAKAALWSELGDGLMEALKEDARLARRLAVLEAAVAALKTTPSAAARIALKAFLGTD